MTSRVWAARTSFGSAHNLKYGESRVPLRSFVPEIRKDYATPTWVVFSAARSQRPGAFRNQTAVPSHGF